MIQTQMRILYSIGALLLLVSGRSSKAQSNDSLLVIHELVTVTDQFGESGDTSLYRQALSLLDVAEGYGRIERVYLTRAKIAVRFAERSLASGPHA